VDKNKEILSFHSIYLQFLDNLHFIYSIRPLIYKVIMKSKTAKETTAITTHIVLPNDTNPLGNLFGGQLLAWMDVIASVSAQRHCRRVVVTASVNNVSFREPILQSSIVTLEAKVSRAFSSSMEVFVDVYIEDPVTGLRNKSNEAIYTFVAVDQMGVPIQVPELIPESQEENERFAGALRRKQLSLILAGKLNPSEANELKALFFT
jgi:acyl-CoA hydrolase